ncbi:hypothetical protein OLK001_04680 [Synechocystis sp. LKSZ1]
MAKAEALFAAEAQRLEELGHHDQIPALLAYFTVEGRQYLVQEYIEGENLDEELKRLGTFDEAKIRQVLLDLLPVLDFIHQRQVIHRDIKPENIIRRALDQKLVLVDFGAAKQLSSANRARTGTVIGTVGYASPEQMNGKAVSSSDLYSLGVTCLHLLTGIEPGELFDLEEYQWDWHKYLKQQVISHEIKQILGKLVNLGISKRYTEAILVVNDLQERKSSSIGTKNATTIQPKGIAISTPIQKAIPNYNYAKLYDTAYAEYNLGNYQEACRLIKLMEAKFSDDPNILLLHGHILVGLEKYDEAYKKYRLVLSLSNRQDILLAARKSIQTIESLLLPENNSQSVNSNQESQLILNNYQQGRKNFSRKKIGKLILKNTDLPDINFHSSDLSYSDFQNSRLIQAVFENAILVNANFGNTNLFQSNFKKANLVNASFKGANLQGADFRGTDVTHCDFTNANLKDANLCGIDLRKASISLRQLAIAKTDLKTEIPDISL